MKLIFVGILFFQVANADQFFAGSSELKYRVLAECEKAEGRACADVTTDERTKRQDKRLKKQRAIQGLKASCLAGKIDKDLCDYLGL